jgi:hypothetical protein
VGRATQVAVATAIAACVIVTLSCGHTQNPIANSCSGWPQIAVTSLTPAEGTRVQGGGQLEIEAAFAYSTCREGRIIVFFQDQTEAGGIQPPWTPAGPLPSAYLPIGSGNERLIARLTVPDQGVTVVNARFSFQYIGVAGGFMDILKARYVVH